MPGIRQSGIAGAIWLTGTALVVSMASPGRADDAEELQIPSYRAVYRLEYEGHTSGTTEISVSYHPERRDYEYVSTTRATGLFKLTMPDPIVERSRLAQKEGRIMPMEYSYGGEHSVAEQHMTFDWERGVVAARVDGEEFELPLESGVLDPGSLRVVIMQELRSMKGAARYVLIDEGSFKTYEYSSAGEATIDTQLGPLRTQVVVQQREGSSRRLLLWLAPELSFLPVRMEQQRNGETRMSIVLESVDGLEPGD